MNLSLSVFINTFFFLALHIFLNTLIYTVAYSVYPAIYIFINTLTIAIKKARKSLKKNTLNKDQAV